MADFYIIPMSYGEAIRTIKNSNENTEEKYMCSAMYKIMSMETTNAVTKDVFNDNGWRILLTQLQQRGEMYGRTVILVPPQNTTQTCSVCGHVMKGDDRLKLSDREWTCPQCGTHHDRDQNSGCNILMKGLKILNEAS